MARIKYYYDTEKCKYERVRVNYTETLWSIFGFLSLSILFAVSLLFLYSQWFPSPQETILKSENSSLRENLNVLEQQMNQVDEMLLVLQERDAKIYRVITGAEELPESMRKPGIGGNVDYRDQISDTDDIQRLIDKKKQHIAEIKRNMYSQTLSYDEIFKTAQQKEQMLACIPAIQPVSNADLKRLASGYGLRIHPIYKVKKMHWGCDFSAPKGTPVYATGDGVIEYTKTNYGGYGKQIQIDHGFGYKTKYAHLQTMIIKRGQKVKRGELIGYVGNTGASTAAHLHYEVIHNGKKVNPVHYFFNDLNAEQYEQILKIASVENQSLS